MSDSSDSPSTRKEHGGVSLSVIALLITSILTVVNLFLSYQDSRNKNSQATVDTIVKISELSSSKDSLGRDAGFALMGALTTHVFGTAIDDKIVSTGNFQDWIEGLRKKIEEEGATQPGPTAAECAASPAPGPAPAPGSKGVPTPTATAAAPDQAPQSANWIFVGSWQNGSWKSRYIDVPATKPYNELKGGTFRIWQHTGALNVRSGPSTPEGLAPIIATLAAGTTVHVLDVETGSSASSIWASVAPTPG